MSSQTIFLQRGTFQWVLQARRIACGTGRNCGHISVKFTMGHGKVLSAGERKKRRRTTDMAIPIKLSVFFLNVILLWEKEMRELITNSLYGNSLLATTWITPLNL
jgi:hypothetical protein